MLSAAWYARGKSHLASRIAVNQRVNNDGKAQLQFNIIKKDSFNNYFCV